MFAEGAGEEGGDHLKSASGEAKSEREIYIILKRAFDLWLRVSIVPQLVLYNGCTTPESLSCRA